MNIACPVCGLDLKDRKGLSCHLTRKHSENFSSLLEREKSIVYTLFPRAEVEETIEGYLRGDYPISRLPIDISLYIELLGLKRTHSEEKKSLGYKKRISETLKNKYGVEAVNVSQVPEIKAKIREAARRNYPSQVEAIMEGVVKFFKDPDRVRAAVSKLEETCLKRYGHRNFGQGEAAKAKAAQKIAESWANIPYEERLNLTLPARKAALSCGFVSEVEKRVRRCLEIMGIKASYNHFMWKYNFDMVWGNTVLEVQGDLWHANPLIYQPDDLIMGTRTAKEIWEKDSKKRELATRNGFSFIEVWEKDIRSCRTDEQLILLLQKLIDQNHDST